MSEIQRYNMSFGQINGPDTQEEVVKYADHEADKQAALAQRDAEVRAVIETIPSQYVVHVCVGGLENIYATLVVSVRKVVAALTEKETEITKFAGWNQACQRQIESQKRKITEKDRQIARLTAQLSVEKNEHELAEKCADTHYQTVKALTAEIAQAKERAGKLEVACKQVLEDLSIASETWLDSDAGPATKLGESKDPNNLDVCLETQELIRKALAPQPSAAPKDQQIAALTAELAHLKDMVPKRWWCCTADYPKHDDACPNNTERLKTKIAALTERAEREAQLASDLRATQDQIIERCAKAIEDISPDAAIRLRSHCGRPEDSEVAVSGEDFGEMRRQNATLTAERDKMTDMLMAAAFLGHGTQLIGDQRYKDLLAAEAALAQAKELLQAIPRMLNEAEVPGEYEAHEINTGSRKKICAMIDGFREEIRKALRPQPPAGTVWTEQGEVGKLTPANKTPAELHDPCQMIGGEYAFRCRRCGALRINRASAWTKETCDPPAERKEGDPTP